MSTWTILMKVSEITNVESKENLRKWTMMVSHLHADRSIYMRKYLLKLVCSYSANDAKTHQEWQRADSAQSKAATSDSWTRAQLTSTNIQKLPNTQSSYIHWVLGIPLVRWGEPSSVCQENALQKQHFTLLHSKA